MKQFITLFALACLISTMNAQYGAEDQDLRHGRHNHVGHKRHNHQDLFNFGVSTPFGGLSFGSKKRA